jgi:hypothetical protein
LMSNPPQCNECTDVSAPASLLCIFYGISTMLDKSPFSN